ncbi:beta-glucosidase BglX [Stakelama sediminis]|uniref:Beta-D-glucoside glucohydrolase n=1 Tax=Stakelama sediminis TaxID=463200 RepID=A0A840Z344_9SPHN|nr:beta-glucosidase BglX [Stakelama sediminis]MBB5720082.1 beta-glucosidase [Stakelama sediminis]
MQVSRRRFAQGLGLLAGASALPAMAKAEVKLPDTRIETLIAQMTIEEKAAQLSILGSDAGDLDAMIKQGLGGTSGVLPDRDVYAYTRQMQQLAMQSRLKIPLWFMGDVAHGFNTEFPVPLALAATWNPELVTSVHRAAAIEATTSGVNWTFSPMLDIARDPRWGRMCEGAGEDPHLGSVMAVAQVKGFQGDDLSTPDTMLATAKHFAGYGAVTAGRDYNPTDIPPRLFRDIYLSPFKAVVDAGIGSFMAAFTPIDGVPATSSRTLLTGILRDQWGFDGLVVSDYDAVLELVAHGVAADPAHAAQLALHAGVDIDLHSGTYWKELPGLVKSGRVKMAEVDTAVRRVLTAKAKLGLFDDAFRYGNAARAKAMPFRPSHLALAREAARQAMVLLKNDGTLPLAKQGKIAVIGPMADKTADLLGPMPALGRKDNVVSMLAGISAAMQGRGSVTHVEGVSVRGDDVSGIPAAVSAASDADIAILVLGETDDMIGEGDSRAFIDLPGRQRALAEAVIATGKPTVAVVITGRAMDLTWLDGHANALVDAMICGEQAGNALADLLFGDANFSGKLPVTMPRALGQVPIFYNHLPAARPGQIDTPYTSRYVDLIKAPLYWFGHGLSYTSFDFGKPRLSGTTLAPGGTLTVTTRVTNSGRRAGATVVQLYVRDRLADVSRPVRELKGFRRVELKPGESRDVALSLTPADLAFARRDLSWGTEAGVFDVYVGEDSTATQTASFTLTTSEDMTKGNGGATVI